MSIPLKALALCCSLKPSPNRSSSELLGRQVLDQLGKHGVSGSLVRMADHDVKHSTLADSGPGDAWPGIRAQLLEADILIVSVPIWNGQPSSQFAKLSERLNAMLSEKNDHGHTPMFGKVAVVAVVGNEDGAHHVSAVSMQVLNDMQATIPAQASVYWVGEAMASTDYQDLDQQPDSVRTAIEATANNAASLAYLLAGQQTDSDFPPNAS